MGAYNRFHGEPCCGSQLLLVKILREEWGFAGHVVSDCGAIDDIYRSHQVVETPEQAAALAVRAGCDLECGNVYAALPNAVKQGLVTEAEIDRSLGRLLNAKFRLGMFDPPEKVPYAQIPITVNDCAKHRRLARRDGAGIDRAPQERRRPAAQEERPADRRGRPERRRSRGAAGQL